MVVIFQIPSADTDMDQFPKLKGREFEVEGIGYKESGTDVQLSSIGMLYSWFTSVLLFT